MTQKWLKTDSNGYFWQNCESLFGKIVSLWNPFVQYGLVNKDFCKSAKVFIWESKKNGKNDSLSKNYWFFQIKTQMTRSLYLESVFLLNKDSNKESEWVFIFFQTKKQKSQVSLYYQIGVKESFWFWVFIYQIKTSRVCWKSLFKSQKISLY